MATTSIATNDSLSDKIKTLINYSACDVSDALVKLEKPPSGQVSRGGYLADIVPFAPSSPFKPDPSKITKHVALASTLKLVAKSSSIALPTDVEQGAIPKGSHWVDLADPETVVVIEQPEGQTCAAIGGIMAQRMAMRGVTGCVVGGRVRDLEELAQSGLPVWAEGRSTVGTGAEAKVFARNVPIQIGHIKIHPGDIVFCDDLEGIVVIPEPLLDEILSLIPKLVEADDKVKADVAKGSSVQEAFKKYRN